MNLRHVFFGILILWSMFGGFVSAETIQFQNPQLHGDGKTRVDFQLQQVAGETIKIKIENNQGKVIADLLRPAESKATSLSWDCTLIPSGIYYARVIRKGKPDKKIKIEVRH